MEIPFLVRFNESAERADGQISPFLAGESSDVNERFAGAERDGQVPPIPEHVLVKPPSAELAPGQEDEKSMGIDYPTLDRMLIAHFEHGVSENGLVEAGFNRADVERVLAKVRSQAFKRALEPPYPDVKFYE